jgi:hypothetical protein
VQLDIDSQYVRPYLERRTFELKMIEIHLHDCLGELVIGNQINHKSVIIRKSVRGESLGHLISSLGLNSKELGDCYINGMLAKPNDIVEAGDRIELRPVGLGLLRGGHLK